MPPATASPSDPIWNEGGYGNNVIQRVRVEVR